MSKLVEGMREWGCDVKGALERMVDDTELYEECMQMFAADENFAQLEQAIEQDDYARAFENAHALKGVSGNLGLAPMQQPISELTELLRAKGKQTLQQQQNEKDQTHQTMTLLYQKIMQQKSVLDKLVKEST